MTADLAFHLMSRLLWNALLVSGPVLAVVLLTGVVVSIVQVVTSIQESTLTFVPKIAAAVFSLLLCGAWMLHKITLFAVNLWTSIPGMF